MVMVLYNKERQVLEFIMQYVARNGYAPTLIEIAQGLGLNAASTIHEHVQRLITKGYLKKTPGSERGIEIVSGRVRKSSAESALELPVLGFIAAGSPLEPHTDPNFYMSIPANMINPKKQGFILQVKGSSLIDEGIFDGDFVVIEHQNEAKNGELVVAILPNGLATLKKIFYEKERIRLEPANTSMSPIYATSVKVQGRVVAVFRKYN